MLRFHVQQTFIKTTQPSNNTTTGCKHGRGAGKSSPSIVAPKSIAGKKQPAEKVKQAPPSSKVTLLRTNAPNSHNLRK